MISISSADFAPSDDEGDPLDLIESACKAYARARIELIDKTAWRMISHGRLFSLGWRLAVIDRREGLVMSTHLAEVAPGAPPPHEACYLLNLSSTQ